MFNEKVNEQTVYCNQCPNHCPVNELKCNRGRNYFAQGEESNDNGDLQKRQHGHEQSEGYGRRNHERHGGHGENQEYFGHARHEDCGGHGRHDSGRGHEKGNHRRGHGPVYEKDDLYSMMRACGHQLYHGSNKGSTQEKILSILAEKDSITQKELQQTLGIQPGSVSEILGKLEEKDMISRKRDEEDQRKCVLSLTDKGKENAVKHGKQEEKQLLFGALNTEEQNTLKQLLFKLLESWK